MQAPVEVPQVELAAPFIIIDPLTEDTGARIAPALSHALMLCRKHQHEPKKLVQVVPDHAPILAADLRRWPGAKAEVVDLPDVLKRLPKSVDVFSTRFLFSSDEALAGRDGAMETGLGQLGSLITPSGLWHLTEALSCEQSAHWAFTYFPELWECTQTRGVNLHNLYGLLQQAGFKPEVKRHRYYQPARLGTALEIVQLRPGLLGRLEDQAYQQGLARLTQAVQEHGWDHVVGSEMTVVEIWAQRTVKSTK